MSKNQEISQVYVNVGEKGYDKLTEKSKEISMTRLAYTRALLIKKIDECPDITININTKENLQYGRIYIHMRVPKKIKDRLEALSEQTGISIPRIAGHIVLEALEEGYKI